MPEPVDAGVEALPFAHGRLVLGGRIRVSAEDFRVSEILGFEPSGEGEHAFLDVEKRGLNTDRVATALARFAGVKPVAVGYAGMKDRHAVTRQFFTVQLPGRQAPDWSELGVEGAWVLEATRHHRKIRRGALRGNRFCIVARELTGEREAAAERLETVRRLGVPNYFGEQRFGRGGDNLRQAGRQFRGEAGRLPRAKRGIYLSAARSHLFNAVLARRVEDGTWRRGLDGEIYRLDGSRAVFGPESPSGELDRRLAAFDIHPTGPLWGRGEVPTAGECRALESSVLEQHPVFRRGLEEYGMKQERRSLRLQARELEYRFEDDRLELRFTLEPGAYATAVLREILAAGQIRAGR